MRILLVAAICSVALFAESQARAQASRRPLSAPSRAPLSAPKTERPATPAKAPTVKSKPAAPAAAKPKASEPTPAPTGPSLTGPSAAPQKKLAVDPNPTRVRFEQKLGDHAFTLDLRPGRPKAGDTIELELAIEELLAIPDPVVGDRRPVRGASLRAELSGPDGSARLELHELETPGRYGLHRTITKPGHYRIALGRTDDKPGLAATFTIGVGVEPPTPGTPIREPTRGAERRVLGTSTKAAVPSEPLDVRMERIGRSWRALYLRAGSDDARTIAAELQKDVATLAQLAPKQHPGEQSDFERLAKLLHERIGKLDLAADGAATHGAMAQIRDDVCLRCHARFRFELTKDLSSWPDFELQPAEAVEARPASTRRPARRPLPAVHPKKN